MAGGVWPPGIGELDDADIGNRMTTLPQPYAWLANEPGPKMLLEAIRCYGIRETAGAGNTPEIMEWAKALGPDVANVYSGDDIPWCGLFMAHCAQVAGKQQPASPLWARAWATWGEPSPQPALGDVLVFVRDGGGHVGLYVGEDAACYHVLGGNQGDAVSIVRIAKARKIAVRRLYRQTPDNVRPIKLKPWGAISTQES